MSEKYNFTETTIANEKYLYYHLEAASIPKHRDIVLENADKLRIIPYTHQVPDGSESICYEINGYIPLEITFRRRKINFEELILLLYGVVHTLSNAKKCELITDSFVLHPKHVYLNRDSIQPYLLYLPTMLDMTLKDEFISLLDFLDEVADPAIPNTAKLLTVTRDIVQDDFDMHTIINVVVQAANKKEVIAPKRVAKPAAPPARQSAPRQATPPPAAAAKQPEQKQGFLSKVFGFGMKQQEAPDDFVPTIDDRTMIDFTAYGDDDNRPVLFVMEGVSRTVQIPVTTDAFVLGRNREQVDFCFDGPGDKGISRVHAAIIFDGSNYYVIDKGSAGGTFVNDTRLAPSVSAQLKNGDVIRLYTKKLLFELPE